MSEEGRDARHAEATYDLFEQRGKARRGVDF